MGNSQFIDILSIEKPKFTRNLLQRSAILGTKYASKSITFMPIF